MVDSHRVKEKQRNEYKKDRNRVGEKCMSTEFKTQPLALCWKNTDKLFVATFLSLVEA